MRDQFFWLKLAEEEQVAEEKKRVAEQVEKLSAMRLAMHADAPTFTRAMNALRFELDRLEGRAEEVIRDNWEDLKMMKKG